jgi:hypothetical protein
MAILFTDDFNRADSGTPGSNWTEGNGGADISGNRLRMASTGGGNLTTVATAAAAHADTADCKVTVTQVSATADGGPAARMSGITDSTPTLYGVDVFSNTCQIERYNNSAVPTVLRTTSITQVANGVIALYVEGTGATVTLRQFYNGVQQGADVSDTAAGRITTADRTGVYNWITGGTTTREYDDFQVENLVSGSKPFRRRAPRFFRQCF